MSAFAASLQQDDPHGQGSSDNHARHALWAFNGCLILVFAALIVAAALVVRHVIDDQSDDVTGASTSTSAAADPTTPSDTTPSDDQDPSEDSSDATAQAGPEDALPAHSPVTVPSLDGGSLEVSTGRVDWDADKAIEKAGPSVNPEAPDGQKYILVPVHAAYHGERTSTPGVEVSVEFVDQDGADHRQEVVVTPKMWTDHTDLDDGEDATWDLAFLVPEDTKDGTLCIHSFLTDGGDQDAVYVSAR
jgi:cytoskeletal protein RodZ